MGMERIASWRATRKPKRARHRILSKGRVNWGIGRELYTAPFIYVPLSSDEWRNGYPRINISVSQIEYDKDKAEIVD